MLIMFNDRNYEVARNVTLTEVNEYTTTIRFQFEGEDGYLEKTYQMPPKELLRWLKERGWIVAYQVEKPLAG